MKPLLCLYAVILSSVIGSGTAKLKIRAKSCKLRKRNVPVGATHNPLNISNTCAATGTCAGGGSSMDSGYGAVVIRPRFTYGSEKIRGVNLGGWFVLEPWITPSVFDQTGNTGIVDEYTFGLYQPNSNAPQIIANHWDTWITQSDFAAISAAGLNHVRIPFPYWAVPTANTSTAPFITGSWPRLLRAVSWASNYSISVIIDIHGAPGSQNGYDNSGQVLPYPQWQTSSGNINHTLEVFQTLLQEFGQPKWGGTVGAIEALNEPAGYYEEVLVAANAYWQQAYEVLVGVRTARDTQSGLDVDPAEMKMVIMDGFQGVGAYNGFLAPPASQGVMMDTHIYEVFDGWPYVNNNSALINAPCQVSRDLASYADANIWTYVGEWTTAMTDCAPWLNGRWKPSVWETAIPGRSCAGMTGAWQTFSQGYKTSMAQFFEAQVTAYEQANGWIFWTWKTESADEWSYSKGIEGGWIPTDINDYSQRQFPNICGP